MLLLEAGAPAWTPALPTQGPPPPPAKKGDFSAWRAFSPPDKSFTARFPGQPENQASTFELNSNRVPYTVYTVKTGAGMYVVTFADFPTPLDAPEDIKQNLDAGRNLALKNIGGTLVSEKDLTLSRHPGREMAITRARARVRERIFLAGRRMYQVAAVLPDIENAAANVKDLQETSAAYFLNSFQLTGK